MQKIVTLSTIQADYVAVTVTEASKELIRFQVLLTEMGFTQEKIFYKMIVIIFGKELNISFMNKTYWSLLSLHQISTRG